MSFEDLLKKRLGPMRDLMRWGEPKQRLPLDPSTLWYRRALGVDLRLRPDDTWADVEVAGASGQWRSVPRADALALAGLTRWCRADETGLSRAAIEGFVAQDALYFATAQPQGHDATGRAGALHAAGIAATARDQRRDPASARVDHEGEPSTRREGVRIARRRSMTAVPALETSIEIAPFPFMPRGRELLGTTLAGFRWGSRERGHEVFSASITGQPRTGRALRSLLPLLDGARTAPAILAAIPAAERAHAAKLLDLLDGLTALTTEPVPRWPARQDPRVTWLGHAAVLIETCGLTIAVDPLFFADSDPPERWRSGDRFDARTLPPIDLVLITHGDNDHLNPTSLAHLPASTPIVIPKVGTIAEPWQVDLRGALETLGFSAIHELDTWGTLDVGPLRITACPFEGEDWELELPKATWLIEGPEASLYLSADAGPMPDVYRWLAERPRPLDLAFLGVSGCAEAMVAPRELGYGNFYEPWVPRERRNLWVQHCSGPAEAAQAARIARPRYAFGYASGGASYIQTAYSDVGDHAQLAARLTADAGVTQPAPLAIGMPWPLPR